MAKNLLQEGKQIHTPTLQNGKSGDPFVLGTYQPCVLLTDAESSSPYNATVQTFGIFDLEVHAEGAKIEQYAAVFYDAADKNLNDDGANNKYFGIALEEVESAATETVPVLIAGKPYVPESIAAEDLASNAVTTVKILAGNVTEPKIEPASLTGLVAKVVADDAVIGGIPVIHRVLCLAGASKGAKNITLTHKTRVTDAWIVLGAAGVSGGKVTISNGADAITDDMAATGSDKALVRAASIDRAHADIAAAGTLRVTSDATGDDFPANTFAYILGYRIA